MQLIYRATSYQFQPATITPSRSSVTAMRQLFYRGQAYHYEMPMEQTFKLPKGINWRFSAPTQEHRNSFNPAHI